MEWRLLLLAALVSGGLAVLRWLVRHPRLRCPHCGSRRVGQTSKEPTGLRSVDMNTGYGGGGYAGIQTFYAVRYQCNDCRQGWTDEVAETT
jgi:DNA-directed RNA polymerase subunit RPC12/RpoP